MPRYGRSHPLSPLKPPAAAGSLVAYDLTGSPGTGMANATGGFNPSIGTSFTITPAVGDLVVVGVTGRCGGQAGSGQTVTCTYQPTGQGTSNLTQIGTTQSNGSEEYVAVFYFVATLAVSTTISASAGNGANTGRSILTNGVAYKGGKTVSSPTVASGASGTPTVTPIAGTANSRAIVFWAGTGNSVLSTPSQGTQRYAGNDAGFASGMYSDSAGNVGTQTCVQSTNVSWCAIGALIS